MHQHSLKSLESFQNQCLEKYYRIGAVADEDDITTLDSLFGAKQTAIHRLSIGLNNLSILPTTDTG